MSTKIISIAIAAFAVGTLTFGATAQAASFGHFAFTPSVPHISAPMQFNRVNFSSPTSVRQFLSQPQPTNTSSGRYLPWMVKNLYGIHGASQNIAGRAVLGCGC
jgi:hypothetical protein